MKHGYQWLFSLGLALSLVGSCSNDRRVVLPTSPDANSPEVAVAPEGDAPVSEAKTREEIELNLRQELDQIIEKRTGLDIAQKELATSEVTGAGVVISSAGLAGLGVILELADGSVLTKPRTPVGHWVEEAMVTRAQARAFEELNKKAQQVGINEFQAWSKTTAYVNEVESLTMKLVGHYSDLKIKQLNAEYSRLKERLDHLNRLRDAAGSSNPVWVRESLQIEKRLGDLPFEIRALETTPPFEKVRAVAERRVMRTHIHQSALESFRKNRSFEVTKSRLVGRLTRSMTMTGMFITCTILSAGAGTYGVIELLDAIQLADSINKTKAELEAQEQSLLKTAQDLGMDVTSIDESWDRALAEAVFKIAEANRNKSAVTTPAPTVKTSEITLEKAHP